MFKFAPFRIPKDVRKFIYAFAVFNSAISPYLYGYFSFDVKKELKLLFTCSRTTASDRHLSCSANVVRWAMPFWGSPKRPLYNRPFRNSSSQRIRKRSASATHLVPSPPKTVTPVLTTRGHSLRTAKKPALINKSATTLSPQTALRIWPLHLIRFHVCIKKKNFLLIYSCSTRSRFRTRNKRCTFLRFIFIYIRIVRICHCSRHQNRNRKRKLTRSAVIRKTIAMHFQPR